MIHSIMATVPAAHDFRRKFREVILWNMTVNESHAGDSIIDRKASQSHAPPVVRHHTTTQHYNRSQVRGLFYVSESRNPQSSTVSHCPRYYFPRSCSWSACNSFHVPGTSSGRKGEGTESLKTIVVHRKLSILVIHQFRNSRLPRALVNVRSVRFSTSAKDQG